MTDADRIGIQNFAQLHVVWFANVTAYWFGDILCFQHYWYTVYKIKFYGIQD